MSRIEIGFSYGDTPPRYRRLVYHWYWWRLVRAQQRGFTLPLTADAMTEHYLDPRPGGRFRPHLNGEVFVLWDRFDMIYTISGGGHRWTVAATEEDADRVVNLQSTSYYLIERYLLRVAIGAHEPSMDWGTENDPHTIVQTTEHQCRVQNPTNPLDFCITQPPQVALASQLLVRSFQDIHHLGLADVASKWRDFTLTATD